MIKEKKKQEFIPLHNDLMFKGLFGNQKNIKYTTYLLECLFNLNPDSLKGSTIDNSIVLTKEVVQNKTFSLDVVLKTKEGVIYDLEMQTIYDKNAEIKNVMYISRLFGTELNVGDFYKEAKPVNLINFTKIDKLHKTKRTINPYVMTSIYNHEDKILEDLFVIYIIDINNKMSYNSNNKRFEELRHLLGAETLEEAEKIIDKSNNPLMKDMYEEMRKFMNTEYIQDYSLQDKLIRSRIHDAEEEGIAKGEHNKQIEIAKKMFKHNKSINEISMFTDLPISELKKIKKELN